MIALDANILVRYLTCDGTKQFEVARTLLESLTLYASDRNSHGLRAFHC